MRTLVTAALTALAVLTAVSLLVLTLAAQQIQSLAFAGQSGTARVVQVNGANYVEVDGLARLLSASLSFNGNQIVLALAGSAPSAAPPPPAQAGFSKEFLNAGIEAMAVVREWNAALKNGIQGGIPLSEVWLNPYRNQAQQALRLASVAANTDADRSAMPLLTSEFQNMNKLTNKYLQMTKSMTYIDPDSLANDPIEQQLYTCGHSLAAMVANNQFYDDGTCH